MFSSSRFLSTRCWTSPECWTCWDSRGWCWCRRSASTHLCTEFSCSSSKAPGSFKLPHAYMGTQSCEVFTAYKEKEGKRREERSAVQLLSPGVPCGAPDRKRGTKSWRSILSTGWGGAWDSGQAWCPGRLPSLQRLHTFWRLYFLDGSLSYWSCAGQSWQSLRHTDFYLKLVFDNVILWLNSFVF